MDQENRETEALSAGAGGLARILRYCRTHPYMTAVVVVFTITGAVCGVLLPFGESLSVPRRILGGALIGAFFALCPMGARLFE
ncbi:MAG: hypothetical protein ACE5FL_07600 [Myxococcota bacterium]